MRFFLAAALAAIVLTLNACSSWQPPPETWAAQQAATSATKPIIKRWSGYLSLRLDAWQGAASDGGSFLFDLQGPVLRTQLQAGQLDISTPLGTLMASIRWSDESAVMHTPDGPQQFDSLNALLQQTLGEALPISTLTHWLEGHADPAVPSITLGTASFEQAAWRIDASQISQGLLRATRTGSDQVRGARLVIRLDQ